MVILIIFTLIVLYFLIPPSDKWIYSNKNGELIKVTDVYKNIITLYYVTIDERNKLTYVSNSQNVPLMQFKLMYFRWKRL